MKTFDELAKEIYENICKQPLDMSQPSGPQTIKMLEKELETYALDILNAKALKMSGVSSNARGVSSGAAIAAHASTPLPRIVSVPMSGGSSLVQELTELNKRIYGEFSNTSPYVTKYVAIKCECGAEKVGSFKHSSYCAKYIKE